MVPHVFVCSHDGLPCSRFDDDIGAGVCELEFIDKLGVSHVDSCSRFVLEVFVSGS
jgi:hypothetical protein